MKRWLGWFFAGLGVVFFLLSLDSRGHPLLVNSELHSGWNRLLGTWTECVSISSSTAIRAASHAVTRSRCAPLASFATHSTHPGFLITRAIGPPGLDYRGPPGLRGDLGASLQGCRSSRQRKQWEEHASSMKFPPKHHSSLKSGFCNSL